MFNSGESGAVRRRLIAGAPVVLVAFGLALSLAGALFAAPAETAGAGAADSQALGAKLYAQRCGRCHDDGGDDGRAPLKDEIAARSPSEIIVSLTTGAMKTAAAGLGPDDLRALAVYLTGKAPAVAAPAPPSAEANLCAGRAPVVLEGPAWNGWGRDLEATRFQPNPGLTAAEVPRLKVKWAFVYPGVRNGQPSLVGDRVYLSSFGGRVYSLDAASGCVHWRHDLDAGVRTAIVLARVAASPSGIAAVFGDTNATVHALDAATGKELWARRIEDHPLATVTGSPVVDRGRVYVPVSSNEETIASLPRYVCCTFRGSVVALDAETGKPLWKTYAVAEAARPTRLNGAGVRMYGPAGGAIWSAPTIDRRRGLLYAATGDSYTDSPTQGADAIIAMDLATGAMRWVRQMTQNDNFLVGCRRNPKPVNCPDTVGTDYDFGASPVLKTLKDGRQVLLVGQKSGLAYGLDPDHEGEILWRARLGAGGSLGGIQWGMAADSAALYVAISDITAPPADARPGLSAVDVATGKILWTTPSPKVACDWGPIRCSRAQSAAVTAIPGVVFSAAMNGHLRAYAAADGQILWDFDTAGQTYSPVNGAGPVRGGFIDAAGPTLARGMLFQHTGYGVTNGGANVLLAFSVDGR